MRKLLTPNEQLNVGKLKGVSIEEETLLRFSFKESIYKAMHPFLLRPISFQEVEVEPLPDGTAEIVFKLTSSELFSYSAEWLAYKEDYWITCAKLSLK